MNSKKEPALSRVALRFVWSVWIIIGHHYTLVERLAHSPPGRGTKHRCVPSNSTQSFHSLDEFRVLWSTSTTHGKVWHKMAAWMATRAGWPSKRRFWTILFYASPGVTKAHEIKLIYIRPCTHHVYAKHDLRPTTETGLIVPIKGKRWEPEDERRKTELFFSRK